MGGFPYGFYMGSILRFQGLGLGFGLGFRVVAPRILYMWVYIRLAYLLTTRVTQLNRSAKYTRALSLIFSFKQGLRLRSPKLRSYFCIQRYIDIHSILQNSMMLGARGRQVPSGAQSTILKCFAQTQTPEILNLKVLNSL